jgi:hypothetical protein
LTARLGAVGIHLPPSFDPRLHSPAVDWLVDTEPMVAGQFEVEHPESALLEHAAAGGAIVNGDEQLTDPGARSMASAVARRWAFREHAPWVRTRQILGLVGIDTFESLPSVVGVLVSNRPDLIPAALRALARQTYPRLSVIVGLHGAGDPATVMEAANDAGIEDLLIVELRDSLTLGASLNRSIAETSAAIVAKIDDDDHYGPAYIEDAVQALIYSGAPIVGKATQFTYIEDRDATVLRRPGTEETPISGMPIGASLVFRRSVWETTRFPHRARQVDVHFVRGARLAGAEVYAPTRWEFRYYRGSRGHTWVTEPEVLLAGAEAVFEGDDPERTEARGWPIVGGR